MTAQHQDRQPPNDAHAYPGALAYIKHITEAAECGDLDSHDVAILTALAIRFAGWDDGANAWPSNARLAAVAGCSKRTAKYRLTKLEELGWLTRQKRERKPSIITLRVGQEMPQGTGCPIEGGAGDAPGWGKSCPGVGQEVPGGGAGGAPEPYPRTTPKNYSTDQEQGEGVPTVVPRASAAPEREAEPAPPLVRFDEDVDDWGAEAPTDESMRLARGLVKYLEQTYVETGHRSTDLAGLLAPLLDSERWDADSIRDEVKRALPGVRSRFSGRTRRAIGVLLGDMAEAGYGTRPGRSPERGPSNTIGCSASVLAFLQEAQDECEARDALLYGQGVA